MKNEKNKTAAFQISAIERDWPLVRAWVSERTSEFVGAFETSNEINKGAATNCDAMFVNIH